MFKNTIAPMQAWLLSQGRCVGCGRLLENKKFAPWKKDKTKKMVSCTCARIYIHDPNKKKYRRALLNEI